MLNGENTYSGKTFVSRTFVSSGELSIDADSRLGRPPATPVSDHLEIHGQLRVTASFAFHANRGIRGFGGVIIIEPGVILTVPGTLTGGIQKGGEGTLILAAPGENRVNIETLGGPLRLVAGGTLDGAVLIHGPMELAGDYIVPAKLTLSGQGYAENSRLASMEGHNVISSEIILAQITSFFQNPRPPFDVTYSHFSQGNYNIEVGSGSVLEVSRGFGFALPLSGHPRHDTT